MSNNQTNSEQNTKPNSNSKSLITDFGTRTIHNQNFSKMVALPKTALENLGSNISKVNVQLILENEIKYIKLIPIQGGQSK